MCASMVCENQINHEELISQTKTSGASSAHHLFEFYSSFLHCPAIYHKRPGITMLRCYLAKPNLANDQPLLPSEAREAKGGHTQSDHPSSRRSSLICTPPHLLQGSTHRPVLASMQAPGKHSFKCFRLDLESTSKDRDMPSSRQTTTERCYRS
jgi:hypothetical protein